MSVQPMPRYTPAQYLAIERAAETKSEFYAGEMFAMAGASLSHVRITLNIGTELTTQLRGSPCEPFMSDLRVLVDAVGLYTYPDVIVACDDPNFADSQFDTLLNPSVLIEVLSGSTEKYDRGKKFEMYRQLPSLRQYVLVSQDSPHVEVFTREDAGWHFEEVNGLDAAILLDSIAVTLTLSRVYDRVNFPESIEYTMYEPVSPDRTR